MIDKIVENKPQSFRESFFSSTKKKRRGFSLKIFLRILCGCLIVSIIVGIVGWFLVREAAKKAEEEFEKASKKWEENLNETKPSSPLIPFPTASP